MSGDGDDTSKAAAQPVNSLLELSGWGKINSTIRGLLLIAVTLGVFWLLFRKIDLAGVLRLLSGISWRIWLSSTLLTIFFPVLSAIRWHIVLRILGFEVPVGRCLQIIIGIWPLSSISPSKAGDFLKAVSLRSEIRPALVAGSVLTERVLDVLMLSGFALAGGLILGNMRLTVPAALVAGTVLGLLLVAASGIRFPVGRKVQATLADLFRSLKLMGSRPWLFTAVLVLTAGNWLASILQTKLLFHGVGASVPLGFTIAALPIAIFAGLVPVTFGGMGTRDSAMVVLFSVFTTAQQALAVGLLYSFFGYWLLAVLGIPWIKKALNI